MGPIKYFLGINSLSVNSLARLLESLLTCDSSVAQGIWDKCFQSLPEFCVNWGDTEAPLPSSQGSHCMLPEEGRKPQVNTKHQTDSQAQGHEGHLPSGKHVRKPRNRKSSFKLGRPECKPQPHFAESLLPRSPALVVRLQNETKCCVIGRKGAP